jgi:superfamily II helicase
MSGKIKLCVWCGDNPAVVPINRDNIGRFKEEICAVCHSERLKDDLRHILKVEKKRREQNEQRP